MWPGAVSKGSSRVVPESNSPTADAADSDDDDGDAAELDKGGEQAVEESEEEIPEIPDSELNSETKADIDEALDDITADLRQALRDKKRRGNAYLNLASYAVFCIFYMVVVYLQSDVFNGFTVTSSVRRAFVPMDEGGLPLRRMSEPTEILDWLVHAAIPVWVNEVCGDGVCNEPFEYPAYGRFGCRSDCGTNTRLVTMLLQIRADFRDDLYSPLALMTAASWNMCRRDEAAKKAGFPDVCWWEEDRKFTSLKENHLETVNVPPDTLWFISIKGDYMGRVDGSVFISEGSELPWVGTVPEWKACKRNVVNARATAVSGRRLLSAIDHHDDAQRFTGAANSNLTPEDFRAIAARLVSHKRVGTTPTPLIQVSRPEIHNSSEDTSPTMAAERKQELQPQRKATHADIALTNDQQREQRQADHTRVPRALTSAAASSAGTVSSAASRRLLQSTSMTTQINGKTVTGTLAYDSTLVPATEMTWEAWIKPSVSGRLQTLMMVGDFGWSVMLVCNAGEATGTGCCGSHVTDAIGFFMGETPGSVTAGTECANMPSSSAGVPRNVWTHVAVLVSETAATVQFYLNGILSGSTSTLVAGDVVIHDGGGSGSIGLGDVSDTTCSMTGTCSSYDGLMDDVRVWNGLLSPTNMDANKYKLRESHPDYADLRAHYSTTSQSFSVPHDAALAPATTMTFEAWIYPVLGGKTQTLVALGGQGWRVMLMCGGAGSTCCGSHVTDSVGFWMGESPTGVTAGQECVETPSSTAAVTIGEWTHIAVVVDLGPKDVTFVIGGVEENTVQHNGMSINDAGASDGRLTFGYVVPFNCVSNCGSLPFDGFLDGIRIWNTLRTLAEVLINKDLLVTSALPDYSSLVVAYDMVGTSEFTLPDRAANSRDATLESLLYDPRPTVVPAAFNFAGTSHFSVPYAAALAPNDVLTFEAWIKPGTIVKTEVIAMCGTLGWSVLLHCMGGANCCAGGSPVANAIAFNAGKNSNACEDYATSTAGVTRGAWNHIAVTVEPLAGGGKTVSFHIDGVDAGSSSDAAYLIGDGQTSGVLYLAFGIAQPCAGSTGTACEKYTGFMDNIRLWHAALSSLTLLNYKDTLVSVNHPEYDNLIARYSFDSGYGFVVVDRSSAVEHNGVITADNTAAAWSTSEDQTLQSSPWDSHVIAASAASFDGDTLFSIEYNELLVPSNEMTFEAWIKPGATVTSEVIAVMGALGWGVMLTCNGAGAGCCTAGSSTVETAVAFISQKSSNACQDMPSSNIGVTRGAWNHIAVTVASRSGGGKVVSFYVDGFAAGISSDADFAIGNGGPGEALTLGGDGSCAGVNCKMYTGMMDNVRIWGAPLPQYLLEANRNLHVHPSEPMAAALIASYSFDSGLDDDHTEAHRGALALDKVSTFFFNRGELLSFPRRTPCIHGECGKV
uniref:LamG-like jellyroll fold domain-containing protein n=1 Tax=Mantoniella antarctica TaxID=81844 RepID=A0A7S0STQ1_9CHLO|mmetsp:Transcript_36089/g.90072  ORF Transcript_36089/g.90072 Transcript_36089/m.90072 type:complete len:1412 (+) Transcript_36089:345-4580(+)